MDHEEIRMALEAASTQHEWDSDGTFIEWKDGNPLKGTHRTIAIFNASTPIIFNNENHENDAYFLLNAPTWLRFLLEENERLTKERDDALRGSSCDACRDVIMQNDRLREELEQVKKERDGLLKDVEEWKIVDACWVEVSENLATQLAEKDKVLEGIANEFVPFSSSTVEDFQERARRILSQYKIDPLSAPADAR